MVAIQGQSDAYNFSPITVMNGIDSLQFYGIRGLANCGGGSKQLLIRYKTMEPVYTPYPIDTTWYRRDEIKFRHSNDTYNVLRATNQEIRFPQGNANSGVFVGYTDITEYVQRYGMGEYWVADIPLQAGISTDTGLFGGWGMVVVYENDEMEKRNIVIQDGYGYVRNGILDIPIGGFYSDPDPMVEVAVQLGIMSGGGAVNRTGDLLQIQQQNTPNFTLLSNPVRNISNNFFASTIFTAGHGLSDLPRNPNLYNNTGMNITMMKIPNPQSSIIGHAQTNTTLRFNSSSSNDEHVVFCVVMSLYAYVAEVEV
jgi:hypothetical protein